VKASRWARYAAPGGHLQGYLERAATGDAGARRRLLELTHDRLTGHARRLLHGRYARLEPFAQTDDVVQQLYLKILQHQDRFWVNADGAPVRTLAEFFGRASAWMRDVLCDQLRQAYGRDDDRPAVLPLDGGPSPGPGGAGRNAGAGAAGNGGSPALLVTPTAYNERGTFPSSLLPRPIGPFVVAS
jgi:hypothetical protein